jgi:hypothetical protein
MADEDDGVIPWEKAFAQSGFDPGLLEDMPDIHRILLWDHLTGLAGDKFGVGRWVHREDVELIEFEPFTRDHEYADTDDDDNPILDEAGNPVMVQYHDDNRHFRMTAWFRQSPSGGGLEEGLSNEDPS